jgi:hypothetical protein
MATKVSNRVNQQELAQELGVSDRRVRQMIDSYILPQPHHDDGGYDLALCRDRYDLYRNGSAEDWEEFFDETIDLAEATEKVVARALSDEGTLADTRLASQSTQNDIARMHFITACRSKSQEERNFFHPLWRREEDRILGGLLYRSMELMGATHLRDDETGTVTRIIYRDTAETADRSSRSPRSKPTKPRRARRAAAAERKSAP